MEQADWLVEQWQMRLVREANDAMQVRRDRLRELRALAKSWKGPGLRSVRIDEDGRVVLGSDQKANRETEGS